MFKPRELAHASIVSPEKPQPKSKHFDAFSERVVELSVSSSQLIPGERWATQPQNDLAIKTECSSRNPALSVLTRDSQTHWETEQREREGTDLEGSGSQSAFSQLPCPLGPPSLETTV